MYKVILEELPYLLQGVLVALELLLAFISLGFLVGAVLAVMRVYGNRLLVLLAILIERFFRGVPAVVLLFLFFYGLSGVPPFVAAVLGLGLRSAAYQSQIFKGAIQAIESGQMTAARALGMGKLKAIRCIIIPQALRLAIGPWSNEFASELKDTSLAYTIGVIELLRRAKYIVSYTYGNNTLLVYGVCALMYLVLVRTGNVILYRLERRLAIPGFERREEGG